MSNEKWNAIYRYIKILLPLNIHNSFIRLSSIYLTKLAQVHVKLYNTNTKNLLFNHSGGIHGE